MKNCLTVLIAAAMLSTSLFCVNAADLDTPINEGIIDEYAYTINVYSEISWSSNTATCRSTVIGKSGVTKIVVSQKLQKKVDGTWTNVKKWSKTVTAVSTTFTNDFLIMFQYENEARKVMQALIPRLGKFGLEVAEDKTRILPIGRFKGTKEDFDFLGFTFYNTKTRTGKYRVGVRTSKKKLKAKKQAAKAWLRTRLTKPVADTMKTLAAVIRGHCNYYGVNGNFHAIQNFWKYLKYATYRMLNRRDQKGKFRYEKYLRVWNYYVAELHLTKDIWNWSQMTV